jgi:DUF971 family protein
MSRSMDPRTTARKLNLKKDEKLDVEFADGHRCTYTISYLRSMCPCAMCKNVREQQNKRKTSLNILPGNYSGALKAVSAEMIGNYALKITFSDNHDTGIYSFSYLREICPE